jgi:hypothetical protein
MSIQILSLEVVLERLHLEHRRQDQDADLQYGPPNSSHVNSFSFPVEAHLLLLHVVRLVEDLRELIIQLDDLDLEPVLCVERRLTRRVDALTATLTPSTQS